VDEDGDNAEEKGSESPNKSKKKTRREKDIERIEAVRVAAEKRRKDEQREIVELKAESLSNVLKPLLSTGGGPATGLEAMPIPRAARELLAARYPRIEDICPQENMARFLENDCFYTAEGLIDMCVEYKTFEDFKTALCAEVKKPGIARHVANTFRKACVPPHQDTVQI
jgi:hypothetical protein